MTLNDWLTILAIVLGPVIADQIGLAEALLVTFALRIISGLSLAKWG